MCPCPCVHWKTSPMNSSVLLQQCLASFCLTWVVSEMKGKWPYSYCLKSAARCSKQHAVSLSRSHLPFSASDSLESKWCNHTVVLAQLLLRRILVLAYQRNPIPIRSVSVNSCPCLTNAYVDIAFNG